MRSSSPASSAIDTFLTKCGEIDPKNGTSITEEENKEEMGEMGRISLTIWGERGIRARSVYPPQQRETRIRTKKGLNRISFPFIFMSLRAHTYTNKCVCKALCVGSIRKH
jgi:hypothetical protein